MFQDYALPCRPMLLHVHSCVGRQAGHRSRLARAQTAACRDEEVERARKGAPAHEGARRARLKHESASRSMAEASVQQTTRCHVSSHPVNRYSRRTPNTSLSFLDP